MFSNACAISDGEYVVVTGGKFSAFDVLRYGKEGIVNSADLPSLSSGRWSHACVKYVNDKQQKVIFLGFKYPVL